MIPPVMQSFHTIFTVLVVGRISFQQLVTEDEVNFQQPSQSLDPWIHTALSANTSHQLEGTEGIEQQQELEAHSSIVQSPTMLDVFVSSLTPPPTPPHMPLLTPPHMSPFTTSRPISSAISLPSPPRSCEEISPGSQPTHLPTPQSTLLTLAELPMVRTPENTVLDLASQFPGADLLIPQTIYRPSTQSDIRRYVHEVTLDDPIMFYMQDPEGCGINCRDAVNSKFSRLVGRDELMFQNRGPSVSVRINVRNAVVL
jgi:hypothetical protein